MKVSVDQRETSNMRKLRVGDRFWEDGQMWEVTGEPEMVSDTTVSVPLRKAPGGVYTKHYEYPALDRVNLV